VQNALDAKDVTSLFDKANAVIAAVKPPFARGAFELLLRRLD
jgi:hypothetical protein